MKGNKMPINLIAYSATICFKFETKEEDSDPSSEIRKIDDIKHLKQYRLVVGTTASLSALVECSQIDYSFTHVIIDEAGQCTEVDALIPMLLVGKEGQIVMAGDPKQMPPISFDIYARDRGLTKSFLSRLLERYSRIGNDSCYMVCSLNFNAF